MRALLDNFFSFLSYGVLKGPGIRLRTQFIFMLFTFIFMWTVGFLLFKLFSVPRIIGGSIMAVSLVYPWLIGRVIDPYVSNNWRLFSPRAKDGVRHLWAYRIVVYLMFLTIILGLGFSGLWWATDV